MTRMMTRAAIAALTIVPTLGFAADLASPQSDVLLTLSGQIGATNHEGTAQFDLGMLQALPQTTYATTTIWTDGVQTFTGVLLSDLLAEIGADGTMIEAYAINDYMVEIPLTDAVPGGALVAYLLNGAPMSIRDKGPLWVVYPYDENSDYQSEITYSRSIWQLDRLAIAQ